MSKDNSIKKDRNIHSAVASYMLYEQKTEINNILRNLGKILPKTGIANELLAILKRECEEENFDVIDFDPDAKDFLEDNAYICNILILRIKRIVIKHKISDEKIKMIEELIDAKL